MRLLAIASLSLSLTAVLVACSSSDDNPSAATDQDAGTTSTGGDGGTPEGDGSTSTADGSTTQPGEECADGFCISPRSSAIRVAQLGSAVFVVQNKPSLQLARVETTGALTPVGPALQGSGVVTIAGDANAPAVLTFDGSGNRNLYVLEAGAWKALPLDNPSAPGSKLVIASIVGAGTNLYASAPGNNPVFRFDGAKFVSTNGGYGATGLVAAGTNVWAFSMTQATRWNGSTWEAAIASSADCAFGVSASPNDATCVGDGSFDRPFQSTGAGWTEASIPNGGWVQALATHGGTTFAVSDPSGGKRPMVSSRDGTTKAWVSKTLTVLPKEELRILTYPGAGTLPDGRLVFAAYRSDDKKIDQDYLVIASAP